MLLFHMLCLLITRYRAAASGGPLSPFGFEEAFKEGQCIQGGKFFKKVHTMTDRHTTLEYLIAEHARLTILNIFSTLLA